MTPQRFWQHALALTPHASTPMMPDDSKTTSSAAADPGSDAEYFGTTRNQPHTPTPWHAVEDSISSEYRDFRIVSSQWPDWQGAGNADIEIGYFYQPFSKLDFPERSHEELQEAFGVGAANARRIVACVNYCKGTPNDSLAMMLEAGHALPDLIEREQALTERVEELEAAGSETWSALCDAGMVIGRAIRLLEDYGATPEDLEVFEEYHSKTTTAVCEYSPVSGALASKDAEVGFVTCTWVWTDEPECSYETSCGGLFQIMTGTPSDNEMQFCPYCGEIIEAHEDAEQAEVQR